MRVVLLAGVPHKPDWVQSFSAKLLLRDVWIRRNKVCRSFRLPEYGRLLIYNGKL
jgi:hypothetical protein